jgi:class 3 adenylate cyclase/tetratricopeptide (TPR) repeat protein
MRCPSCSEENADDSRVCSGCRAELAVECARCGYLNRRAAKYCGGCAEPVRTSAHAAMGGGERRQITVLFCDLVNSTGMSERLDPEDWRDLLRTYQTRCAEIVRGLGGHVAQYLGDGLLVYFGYPLAHEDSPRRAVKAGLSMVQAMARLNAPLALHIRVGIHTGPVVIGEVGDADQRELLAIGETPNLAARVQGAAEPDSVVVSEATHRITTGYFEFQPMGALPLKGFSSPARLYRVERETAARSRLDVGIARGLTPFFDREAELVWMLERWRQALERRGPIALLGGEAGIGKSRLVWVLRERLSAEPFVMLECSCSPSFQDSILHPIREMLEKHLGFAPDVGLAERAERLRIEVERMNLGADAFALLGSLLSLPVGEGLAVIGASPARQRQATFETLVAWLHGMAKDQPVLFVVEDAHWADPSTLQFIGLLAEREPSALLLTVLTHRPEFVCPWTSPRISTLLLPRVPPAEARQIVDGVMKGRALPYESILEVLSKADGVPLFLEEITKAVLDSGSAHLETGGGVDLAPSSTPLPIPPTVRDSLTARLDSLGAGKATVQLAAMLGRTFRFDVLLAVSEMDASSLRMRLDRLEASELLFRGATPHDTYTFKHALIQDAAYASVLRSARTAYHNRIAKVLAEQFPDVANAQPELLAQHYARGGMAEAAVTHWLSAGERALARSAYLEARSSLRNALEQLETMPATRDRDRLELDLRIRLGAALISTHGYSAKEVEENYVRASGLCERLGDSSPEVLDGVWAVNLVRSDREETARLAMLFAALTTKSEDPDVLRGAYASLGVRAFYTGEYGQASELFHRALRYPKPSHIDAARPVQSYFYAILYLGMCDAVVGNYLEARTRLNEALAFAEQVENPYSVTMAVSFKAWFAQHEGDAEATMQLSQRLLDLAVKNEFPFWVGLGLTYLGWGEARAGRVDAGIAHLESGSNLLRGIGAFVSYPQSQVGLVDAYLLAGRVEDALRVVDDALAFCEGKLASNYVPMLISARGDILLALGEHVKAEDHYRQALVILRAQNAKMYELKTCVALAQLLRERQRGDEARALLAAAGAHFEHGNVEFPNLNAAKSLLAEL